MAFITLISRYASYVLAIVGAAAVWWVTSNYYQRRILEERKQAEDAIIQEANGRIKEYEDKLKNQQAQFVAIGKRADAMSQRVLAECKPLGLPGHTDSTSRYQLYGSDGLFLIQFARYCAENLAVCKR